MGNTLKYVFGADIKQQVAARIRAYIEEKFQGNSSMAAHDLGLSRQRLFAYTTGAALPRPSVFDLILDRWGLNLLGKAPHARGPVPTPPTQRSFYSPVTLTSDAMKVVIRRKGARLVASVEISADVRIA